jgi:hypothetical protein
MLTGTGVGVGEGVEVSVAVALGNSDGVPDGVSVSDCTEEAELPQLESKNTCTAIKIITPATLYLFMVFSLIDMFPVFPNNADGSSPLPAYRACSIAEVNSSTVPETTHLLYADHTTSLDTP